MTARKQPEDHRSAAQREAIPDGPVEVDWNGHRWIVESDANLWPATASLALAKLDDEPMGVMIVLEGLLGPAQWSKFRHGSKTTTADAANLAEAIFAQGFGVELGE